MNKQPYVGSVLVVRPAHAILHYAVALLADSQAEAWDAAYAEAKERWTSVSGRVFVEIILESLEEILDESRGTCEIDSEAFAAGAPTG